MPALGVIGDAFAQYDPMPFGLVEADFVEYASSQFEKRLTRLERARSLSLEEIMRVTHQVIDADDGERVGCNGFYNSLGRHRSNRSPVMPSRQLDQRLTVNVMWASAAVGMRS
jgi:hypothetical protein